MNARRFDKETHRSLSLAQKLIGLAKRGRYSLRAADLRDMDFSELDLQDVDFSNADLRRANLKNCDLRGASFDRANMIDAEMAGAQINGATSFSGTEISDGFFDCVSLK